MALFKPSLNLNFARSKKLDTRISFSRADSVSGATYINENGLVVVAERGNARIHHHPISGFCRGLLIEESRTNLVAYSNQIDQFGLSGASCTPNAGISPDGTQNAELITNLSSSGLVATTISVSASSIQDIFISCFVKPTTQQGVTFNAFYTGNSEDNVYFDFASKSVTGLPYSTDYIFESYPNGWYRIGYRVTRDYTGSKTTLNFRLWISGRAVFDTKTCYVWGAQAEIGTFATTLIQTGASPVTRSADLVYLSGSNFTGWYNQSAGTFVASGDGAKGSAPHVYNVASVYGANANNIKARIDSGVSLRCSVLNSSVETVTSSYSNAYANESAFASVNAVENANFSAMSNDNIIQPNISATLPTGMTLLEIGAANQADFLNGCIYSIAYYNSKINDRDIINLCKPNNYQPEENWTLGLDFIKNPNIRPGFYFSRNDSVSTYINSAGFIATASANSPRFEYDPVTLYPRGLLMEESKTNICLYSQSFSNAAWIVEAGGAGTRTDNTATSPTGQTTACTFNRSGSSFNVYQDVSLGGTVETTHSVYLKAGTASSVTLTNSKLFSVYEIMSVDFNLSSGTITSGSNGKITNMGNGWYRCSVTYSGTIPANTTCRFNIIANQVGTFYAFGAQMEQSGSCSSYIQTSGSSVTRAQDVLLASSSGFSSWYNQNEGTFLVTASFNGKATASTPRVFQTTNDSTTDQICVFYDVAASKVKTSIITSGSELFNSATSGIGLNASEPFSQSISYSATAINVTSYDSATVSGALSALPAPTIFRIGSGNSASSPWNGHIRKIKYYPKSDTASNARLLTRTSV